jgi:hypothetical protein
VWGPQLRLALSQVVSETEHLSLSPTPGPLHLWKQFADGFNINEDMQESVAEELRSSVAWQRKSLSTSKFGVIHVSYQSTHMNILLDLRLHWNLRALRGNNAL